MIFFLVLVLSAASLNACNELTQDAVMQIGQEAYIYGYPLVLMDVTKKVMTQVDFPQSNGRAPINQFSHAAQQPNYQFKDVVRPNIDTLYSLAWLDVTKEPIILTVPDTHGRFYVMPLYDMYTNIFAVIGKPTTGTKKGIFAITGPSWKGKLPRGVKQIKAPGNSIWIVGRTQINGNTDLSNVHAIQKQYTLTPLSCWGLPYVPPIVNRINQSVNHKNPMDRVAAMSAQEFFTHVMQLMVESVPPVCDQAMLHKMESIGLVPSKNFDFTKLDSAIKTKLNTIPNGALKHMYQEAPLLGNKENGWQVMRHQIGMYGTHYMQRALVALVGLGALPPNVALYPTATVDSTGKQLSGAYKYVIHFNAGKTPPVNAFWSLTLYDEQGFLVKNSINRYAIGDRDNLLFNADGSLDIYIQELSSGMQHKSNWLPAPKGNFTLTLRLYMPKQSVLNGQWKLPNIKRNNMQE